jgi:thiol-disulfide isomerase/thioredoxin
MLLVAGILIQGCGGPATDTNPAASTESAPPEQSAEPDMTQSDPPEQPRESLPSDPRAEDAATADGAATPSEAGPAETVETPTVVAGATTMILMPWEEIQQHISTNLAGKVVVVDLWATYCQPCRESFPGLVALSKQDPDNIVCVSVSLDDPEDEKKRTEALTFLEEQQATFTNFLCTTDTDTLYDEILKIGGIPAVYVYARDGQLARLFNGPTPEGSDHTYEEHIAPFVTELAADK